MEKLTLRGVAPVRERARQCPFWRGVCGVWFEALLARLPPDIAITKSIIPDREAIARPFMY